MVGIKSILFLLVLIFIKANDAFSLFSSTSQDLLILEDALNYKLDEKTDIREKALRNKITPLLIAPPKHLWMESKNDFRDAVFNMLSKVFSEPGQIIDCPDCGLNRVYVAKDQRLTIQSGDLSMGEFSQIKKNTLYEKARAIAFVEETSSGVYMKIVSLDDGQILFAHLADSSKNLDHAKPYLHFNKEYERRLRGEALSYMFVNLGLMPFSSFTLQLEWLEQWGTYNQHISGIALSLMNPIVALGPSYHYLLRSNPKINFGGTLFVALPKLISESGVSLTNALVLQATAHYALGSSFGVFIYANTDKNFGVGFNLFNPLIVPIFF